ncbi:hypothetical protein HEP87_56900 [Streptomyces sp. S1D4-11]
MGLSIARDISTAHGGTITITHTTCDHDGREHGATFTVRLPTNAPPPEST